MLKFVTRFVQAKRGARGHGARLGGSRHVENLPPESRGLFASSSARPANVVYRPLA